MRYLITQTATVRRAKVVEAPEGMIHDQVIELTWDIPWNVEKVIDSEGVEIEAIPEPKKA